MDLTPVGLFVWDSYGTLGLGRMRVKLKVLQECKEHQMSKVEKWEGKKRKSNVPSFMEH